MQQDNAKNHIPVHDSDVFQEGQRNRSSIELEAQTPNSPDFNVCDLGFIAGIQALRHKTTSRSMEDLANAVKTAWEHCNPRKINSSFITLQKCIEDSTKVHGGKNYKMLHLNKQRRRNEGRPITNVKCDESTFNLARNILNEDK